MYDYNIKYTLGMSASIKKKPYGLIFDGFSWVRHDWGRKIFGRPRTGNDE